MPLRESHAFLVLRALDFLEHVSQVFHTPRDFNQVCEPHTRKTDRASYGTQPTCGERNTLDCMVRNWEVVGLNEIFNKQVGRSAVAATRNLAM